MSSAASTVSSFCGSLRRLSHCRGPAALPHGNTASPTKTSRLTAWRLPLAPGGGGLPPTGSGNTVARSATSTPPNNTARKTSLRRSPPARPHQGRPDLRAAQCRSLYVVPDPQEPPDAQTRDPVPPTQVPAPVSLPDPIRISSASCTPASRPGFPSRVYVRPQRSRVAGPAWTRPDLALDAQGDNTFTWLEDLDQAQALLDQQGATGRSCWTPALWRPTPRESEIPRRFPCTTTTGRVSDSEWASDVLFPSLRKPWPRSTRVCCVMPSTTFTPVDVMRFLGQSRCRPAAKSPCLPPRDQQQHQGTPRGVRIKRASSTGNSLLKMYDKGSVLRVETLIRDPGDFKVYRPLEGDPQGPKEWRLPRARGSATCRVGPRSARRPTRPLPGGADRSPGHDTAAATGRAVVPGGPAPARARIPPQPSRPTDRVRRRGRRVGPESAAARPAVRPRVPHARPMVPRRPRFPQGRHRRADGTARGIPAADGAASASAADGAASASAARRGRALAVGQRGWRWAPAGAVLNPLASATRPCWRR